MRQRQPHGADLLPAGRQAVEHAARDDEVRLRVVVAEREPLRVIDDAAEPRRRSAGRSSANAAWAERSRRCCRRLESTRLHSMRA